MIWLVTSPSVRWSGYHARQVFGRFKSIFEVLDSPTSKTWSLNK